MLYRARKECWFGRLYRAGEEAEFAPATRVPEDLFEPRKLAPAAALSRMAALRRQARDLGIPWSRTWTAADLTAAIAGAQAPDAGPAGTEAHHGQ